MKQYQNPDFGPNLGLKWPKFGPENFFSHRTTNTCQISCLSIIICKISKIYSRKWPKTQDLAQDHSKMEFGDKNNLETAQYLKNEIFPGYAVFARCSQTLCTIIFSQKKLGSMTQISGKSQKTSFLTIFLKNFE